MIWLEPSVPGTVHACWRFRALHRKCIGGCALACALGQSLAGAMFLLMEISMTHSPIAGMLFRMLKQNKKLPDKEAKKCVPMVVTRIVGFVHNAVQVRHPPNIARAVPAATIHTASQRCPHCARVRQHLRHSYAA